MPIALEQPDFTTALYITQAGVHAALAAVLGGLFFVYRRRFLLHWCGAWTAFALYHAGAVLSGTLARAGASEGLRLALSCVLASIGYLQVALLLSGTWLLATRRGIHLGGWLLILGTPLVLGTGLVLASATSELDTRLFVRIALRCLLCALALLVAAGAVVRLARRESSIARWMTALFLAGSGLAHLRHFSVRVRAEEGVLESLSSLVLPEFALLFLQLMLVLSLLTWFFEDERRALQRTALELSEKEEHLRRSEHLEAVGRLAGGVAHDFNNLLTAITGHAELLLARTPPGHPDREDLVPIARASTRAAGLVRELLTFSRRQPVHPRHFTLDRMLLDMRHMLERLAGESIRLELVLNAPEVTVHADPAQIELVVLNLVTNGRDAMPAGGELRIGTRLVVLVGREAGALEPGRYLECEVRDTGCGIPAAALGKVFEPFFTTKQGKGTGLGLASVYGVVRGSGGDVRVTSEVGRGTSFRVLLPLSDALPEIEVELIPSSSARGGDETILLVEDEAQVRELAQRLLTRAGYRVLAAESGDAALVLAREQRLDLVLSDVVMPGLPVPELIAGLRRARPHLPVLLMSGYAESHLRSIGLEHETPFLAKPFSGQGLLRAVRATLDGKTAELTRVVG